MTDVKLTDDLDLKIPTEYVEGDERAVQTIEIRLDTWEGDYILDESQGLPYLEWFKEKAPSLREIRSEVRDEIVTVDGVVRLDDYSVEQEGESIQVSGTIILAAGGVARLDFSISPTGGNSHPYLTLIRR
ncbi:MAG: hypothetical protein ABEN55_00635 [Bradymonadaceae bacterium]